MKTIVPDIQNIAACGLYCGACRKFLIGKCPGCKHNENTPIWSSYRAKKRRQSEFLEGPVIVKHDNFKGFPLFYSCLQMII